MKLVETDTTGPGEGPGETVVEEAVTPPRPEHRRAMTSMVLTLAVLVSTVVMVYMRFPARKHEILSSAIAAHRATAPEWDVAAPSAEKLEGWAVGLLHDKPPLPMPGGTIAVIGARRYSVMEHPAALVRYQVGDVVVSMIVQQVRDTPPRSFERHEGDDLAIAWRNGPWTMLAVGPAATAASWQKALGLP